MINHNRADGPALLAMASMAWIVSAWSMIYQVTAWVVLITGGYIGVSRYLWERADRLASRQRTVDRRFEQHRLSDDRHEQHQQNQRRLDEE